MKYLDKFINHLSESKEDITDLSKEDLDELLIPMYDLGIEYHFTEQTITSGEFSGHKSMNITFRNNFQMGEYGVNTEHIIDPNFWVFLDELVSLKNRLGSPRVSINSNWRNYIVVTFVQKSKVEGDLFTIQKLYNEMTTRINSSKSDFTNNMTKILDKEELKITVNCDGFGEGSYTDRKWNGLFRGIDFSKFNIDKEIITDRYGSESATITITLK